MKKTIVNIAPAVAETPCTKRVAAYARVSCGKDTMQMRSASALFQRRFSRMAAAFSQKRITKI